MFFHHLEVFQEVVTLALVQPDRALIFPVDFQTQTPGRCILFPEPFQCLGPQTLAPELRCEVQLFEQGYMPPT